WTCIESSIPPAVVSASQMRIPVQLPAGAQIELAINIHCHTGEETDILPLGGSILNLLGDRGAEISGVDIYTANEQCNNWINRSAADLKMLVTPTPQGLYPYAGVPWFSTVFGRDGIVTALEYLWMCPEIAKGVLTCLSSTQATKLDSDRDAEPGKIL